MRAAAATLVLLATTSAAVHADERSVRAFINDRVAGARAGAAAPWIEFDLLEQSMWPAAEVQARAAKIEGLPDHPDRGLVDLHTALQKQPRLTTVTAGYASPRSWTYARRDTMGELRAGGGAAARWHLYRPLDGAVVPMLTVIGDSVPYPTSFNAGRYGDMAREALATVLDYGLPLLPTPVGRAAVTVNGDRWTASMDCGDGPTAIRCDIAGAEDPSGITILSVKRTAKAPGGLTAQSRYSAFAPFEGRPVPRRVETDEPSGVHRSIDVRSLEGADAGRMAAAAAVPSVEEGVKVLDFRTADSPAFAAYDRVPRMKWTPSASGDTYQLLPSPQATAAVAAPAPGFAWKPSSWLALAALAGVALAAVLAVRAARGGGARAQPDGRIGP